MAFISSHRLVGLCNIASKHATTLHLNFGGGDATCRSDMFQRHLVDRQAKPSAQFFKPPGGCVLVCQPVPIPCNAGGLPAPFPPSCRTNRNQGHHDGGRHLVSSAEESITSSVRPSLQNAGNSGIFDEPGEPLIHHHGLTHSVPAC